MLFQFIFGVAYVMLVRYGDSANAKNMSNQIHGENQEEELRKNLDKYPCKLSVGKIRQTFISILSGQITISISISMIPTEAILPSFYSDYWYSYDADWWIRIFDDLFEAIWLFFARTNIYCRHRHHWMGNPPPGFHSYGWFIYYQVNYIRVSHQNNIYYFKLLSLNINIKRIRTYCCDLLTR